MDLSSQLNDSTSDQSAVTVDSDQLDEKLPGQSNNRYLHGESGQGKINKPEDSAKEYYRFTNNENRASTISTGTSKDMAFISSNEGYNQSTSSDDGVTDPNVDSSKKRNVHDSSDAERTEGILSGGAIQSLTKQVDETISLERGKECKDDQIHNDLGSSDIEPISVEGNSLRGIEKWPSQNDEDDPSEDTKCISRRNSISPRAEAIHEGNTSAAHDALDINNDIVHNNDRQEDLNSEEENISKKEHLDDEGDEACVVPSRAPKHDAKYVLKYSYESDSENRTGNFKNKSQVQSPSRIIQPISLRSQSMSSIISEESEASKHLIDQSKDSVSLRIEGGINQDEHNRGDSEASYQRDESSKSSSEKDEALKEPSQLTKSQVLTFFSLAISIFLDQVSFSVLAPFFPREAKNKGVSSLQVGFIFGAFALVNVIFSPVFGKFLPRLGAKFTVVSGIWIVAGCNILFGFCDELSSTFVFIVFCYVIRCTAALGTAAAVTASFTIAAQTFPEHVAQTIGLMETFGGLGYMIGPVVGGFLYEVGGQDYKIPFIVLGCADLVCVVLNMALLPSIGNADRKTGSITQFLRIPSVWPVGLTIFVGSASFGFLDPTLSLHVEQFTRSAMIVGLLFLLSGGCYALSSPVWGWMAEKLNISRLMVIIGSIMSGGAFLLMGPSPLLHLPNELWIVCLSLFLCGIFLSASIICSFNDYLISAVNNGLPDDMSTQAVVSGIFNSLLALGNFVGPSVGGVVVHLYTFDWSVTVIGGIQVVVAIMLAIFTAVEFCCHQRRSSPLKTRVLASLNIEDSVQDSMEPLLKGRV